MNQNYNLLIDNLVDILQEDSDTPESSLGPSQNVIDNIIKYSQMPDIALCIELNNNNIPIS